MTYEPSRSPGIDAIWWMTSAFLNGTGAETHAVVEIEMCPAKSATAPAPTAAVCRSGTPHTTGVEIDRPNSAATSGSSVPSTEPVAIRSGSFARSRRASLTKVASYPTAAPGRLSVSHDPIIDAGVAAMRPVRRRPTKSTGSMSAAARRYATGHAQFLKHERPD